MVKENIEKNRTELNRTGICFYTFNRKFKNKQINVQVHWTTTNVSSILGEKLLACMRDE